MFFLILVLESNRLAKYSITPELVLMYGAFVGTLLIHKQNLINEQTHASDI